MSSPSASAKAASRLREPDARLRGQVLNGKWQLVDPVGRGAYGEIWAARHVVTGAPRAIKLLDEASSGVPEARARFVREAQAASCIDSPHVVGVDDIGHDDELGRAYLVMELLRGLSLFQFLARPPRAMQLGEVIVVLRQIAAGLDQAHDVGVIHRDVKPENVHLAWDADGEVHVKLLDFGVAKLMGSRPSLPRLGVLAPRRTEGFLGTPGYAAPEQITTPEHVTPAVDIYAVGMCAFEMLTGERYGPGDATSEMKRAVAQGALEAPSARVGARVWLPSTFDAWFLRACARKPGDRFASAGEAVQALERALDVSVPLEPPKPRARVHQITRTSGRWRAVTPPHGKQSPSATSEVSAGDEGDTAVSPPSARVLADLREAAARETPPRESLARTSLRRDEPARQAPAGRASERETLATWAARVGILVGLVILALSVGVWIGYRLARSSQRPLDTDGDVASDARRDDGRARSNARRSGAATSPTRALPTTRRAP